MSVLTVTGQLNLSYSLAEPLVLSTQTFDATPGASVAYTFVNGLAAVALGLDLHWEESRTLAASASVTYTLSAMVDALPRTLAFTKIRTIIIVTTSRTASDYLTHGPGASNGWTALIPSSTQKIYGLYVYQVDKTDSLAVASGSNDTYKITNAGSAAITYSIYIAGNSG